MNNNDNNLARIVSTRNYPSNIQILWERGEDSGIVSISLDGVPDGTWTDAEAESDAREILRERGLDDTTADDWLISRIASYFPRGEEK